MPHFGVGGIVISRSRKQEDVCGTATHTISLVPETGNIWWMRQSMKRLYA